MSNYITIDGGTTNTRISLCRDHTIADTVKYNVGAGKAIEDKRILRDTLRDGISEILTRIGISENVITCILASGMLTSEFGIYKLDHIEVPAGIGELHDNMEKTVLGDISGIPFVFVRGVKTNSDDFDRMDMMRGEETELMGIIGDDCGECVYILPGSHSKIIKTDDNGRITDFTTMLTGEMIAALSQNTILKDAIDLSDSHLNIEYLMKGFEYCREHGINKTAFKVRVLKNMFSRSADEVYSFFMGTVLCGEICEIKKTDPPKIVIGGKVQIKDAMYEILKHVVSCDIVCVSDEVSDTAASLGMIKVFEFKHR